MPSHYAVVKLNKDWNLIYTPYSSKMAIMDFEITESLPCINKNETSFTPGRKWYPLLRDKKKYYNLKSQHNIDDEYNDVSMPKGCLTSYSQALKFDTRYRFVANTDEEQLFKDNNIDGIVSSLPIYKDYSDPNEYIYNLYARSYIIYTGNTDLK